MTSLEMDTVTEPAPEYEPPSGFELPPDDEPSSRPGNLRPGIGRATLVILLVSAPLLAILYLGNVSLGIPFPPFDLVNQLNRTGFAPWVQITDALIGSTAVNAYDLLQRTIQAQWISGIALFFLLALIVGTLFYMLMRRRGRSSPIVTVIFGLLFVAPFIYAGLAPGGLALSGVVVAWLAGWGIIWALVIDYGFSRLTMTTAPRPSDTSVPSGIDRRQFLMQFGAGAAALAAISGAAASVVAQSQDAIQLQRTLPMISPELLEAQRELFGYFRRFAIIRSDEVEGDEPSVLALGAEYPDRNYVSIWIGGHSPIIVYENLRSALAAYSTEENPAQAYFLDE